MEPSLAPLRAAPVWGQLVISNLMVVIRPAVLRDWFLWWCKLSNSSCRGLWASKAWNAVASVEVLALRYQQPPKASNFVAADLLLCVHPNPAAEASLTAPRPS